MKTFVQWVTDNNLICELLDQPVPYQQYQQDSYDGNKDTAYRFIIDKETYEVELHHYDNGEVNVEFGRINKNTGRHDIGITGTGRGKQYQLFATVKAIVQDYVSKNPNVNSIAYSAEEKSRKKLYNRMNRRLGSETGWTPTATVHPGYNDYSLYKSK